MFYTQNTFHLPAGSFEEMKQILDKIKTEHLAMMRNVTLKLSSLDLTPAVLRAIEEDREDKYLIYQRATVRYMNRGVEISSKRSKEREIPSLPSTYSTSLHEILRKVWQEKLEFARSGFSGLEELRVRLKLPICLGSSTAVLLMRDRNASGLMACCSAFTDCEDQLYQTIPDYTRGKLYEVAVQELIRLSLAETHQRTLTKIKEAGWEKFKRWMVSESARVAEQEGKQWRRRLGSKAREMGLYMVVEEE